MAKAQKMSESELENLIEELQEMSPKKMRKFWDDFPKENIEELKQVCDAFFNKVKKDGASFDNYGEEKAWDLARMVYEGVSLDYRETVSEVFPQNPNSRVYNDMKEDLRTILQSDKLDIYQIDACLKLDRSLAIKMLNEDKKLQTKVEDSLSNPENFLLLEEIKKRGTLKGVLNVDKLLKTATKRLYALPGKDVFRILRHNHDNLEQEQRAAKLCEILDNYYNQTEDLSSRNDNDLFYTSYKDASYWGETEKSWLDEVGKYTDQPAMEKMLEKRLARIYSLYAYPGINWDRDDDKKGGKRYKGHSFCYMSRKGAENFAEKMAESLLKDPQSPQSKFYLQYAKTVFDQREFGHLYLEMAEKLLPKLLPQNSVEKLLPKLLSKHMEICQKMYKDMDRSSMKDMEVHKPIAEKWKVELLRNPDSELSKFYLEYAKYPSSHYVYNFLDMAKDVMEHYKDTRPDVCDKLCESVTYAARIDENVQDSYLVELYEIYPNPKLEEHISNGLRKLDPEHETDDITDYATRYEATGLSGYKDLVAKCLETAITKRLGYVELEGLDGKYAYKDMFEQMRQAGVKEIHFQTRKGSEKGKNFALDADLFVPNNNLRVLRSSYHYDSGMPHSMILVNPEKLLEQAPNLEILSFATDDIGREAVYKALMKHKPAKLEHLDIELSTKKAIELMKKYPDLCVGDRYEKDEEFHKLYARNSCVIAAIAGKDGKERLKRAIEEGVLVETLTVMPKEKLPKKEDFDKEIMGLMHEKYGKDTAKTMQQIAQFSGIEELKQEAELLQAVHDKKVVEYLQSLPQDQRPNIEKLSQPTMFGLQKPGKEKSIFDEIKAVYKDADEYTKVVKEVLSAIGVSKKDIERAADRKDIGEAAVMLLQEEQLAQRNQQGKADFMAWMAKNKKNIDEK